MQKKEKTRYDKGRPMSETEKVEEAFIKPS